MSRVYSSSKIFHYPEKLASLPRQLECILPPIHVRIKPTNACNHNCSYCAYRSQNLQLGCDMSTRDAIPEEKMTEILEDFAVMGVEAVTFSGGGEPLCYRHIEAAFRQLADSGIRFAVLTNGAKLDGERAELLAKHAAWVRVSIDGWDDESYSRYRNVPVGEHSNVMKNMERFSRAGGRCYLGASLIVDQRNAAHVFRFVGRLRDIGVQSVKISPCIVSNDGCENNQYHEVIFAQVREQIAEIKAKLVGGGFELFDAYHELEEKFDKDYDWCPYLQILPVIGADLRVYSCQDKAYNLGKGCLGSIADRRFRDLWCSDKSRFFRIRPREHCRHHCVSNQKNRAVLEYLAADPDHRPFV